MSKTTKKTVDKLNTTESINTVKPSNVTDQEYNSELRLVKKKLGEQKMVKFSIPSQMRATLGQSVFVSINGVHINFPVDGKSHEIPEPLLNNLKESLAVLQSEDVKPRLESEGYLGEIK